MHLVSFLLRQSLRQQLFFECVCVWASSFIFLPAAHSLSFLSSFSSSSSVIKSEFPLCCFSLRLRLLPYVRDCVVSQLQARREKSQADSTRNNSFNFAVKHTFRKKADCLVVIWVYLSVCLSRQVWQAPRLHLLAVAVANPL